MEFGLQFFPDVSPAQRSGEDYWADALVLSQLGEALGFTSIRTVEHYFHPYGGYSPNPLLFLTAAAMVTSTARLITGRSCRLLIIRSNWRAKSGCLMRSRMVV